MISSTKHFLADGGTENGRDQGDAKISGNRAARHPQRGLRAGHRSRRADHHDLVLELERRQKLTGNKGLITDVLKKRMNFDGFTVGDWNAHGQVEGCTNDNCPQAINAGLDMYMAPDSWRGLYENLVKQVKDGTVPMERLDDAVTRILRVKFRAGVFEAGPPSKRAARAATSRCWRRPNSARWRAMPCASRWCCSRTTAACCRSRLTNMCW